VQSRVFDAAVGDPTHLILDWNLSS
jgi:hypothetical protein